MATVAPPVAHFGPAGESNMAIARSEGNVKAASSPKSLSDDEPDGTMPLNKDHWGKIG